MQWFRDLNAKPRLMIGFGILTALIAGIGWLSIESLSAANQRISALYNEDLLGVQALDDAAFSRATNARHARDAMLHIHEPAIVAKDKANSYAALARISPDIEAAAATAKSPQTKDNIEVMRRLFPAYEQGQRDVFALIEKGDQQGALKLLTSVSDASQPLFEAMTSAVAAKKAHAQESFAANEASYRSTRLWIFGFLAVAIGMGLAATCCRVATACPRGTEKPRPMTSLSGAQQQAAALEETSASLEQITATVRGSADNAKQASLVAAGSREAAEKGQDAVVKAVKAMEDINAASTKISDIISTIDEIAFQTNLLAVNAAVEAARAGEQGRGFAVVASEVRSLAGRSAAAAKEIKGLIGDSLHRVERGSELVNRSGKTLQEIVGSVSRVTDIVSEIAGASAEQSLGVEQVHTAVTQMDQVTQSNASQTEELSATAQSLSGQAQQLTQLVSTFKLETRSLGTARRSPSGRLTPPASKTTKQVARVRSVVRPRAAPARRATSEAELEEFEPVP